MAFVHGKDAYISVDGVDLSAFSNNIAAEWNADTHDVTTYGNDAHRYQGGLLDNSATLQGIYDNTVTGPDATLVPLLGQTVPVVYRPEGTGTGLPEKTFNAVVGSFKPSHPVADMVTWECDLQVDGMVATANQA